MKYLDVSTRTTVDRIAKDWRDIKEEFGVSELYERMELNSEDGEEEREKGQEDPGTATMHNCIPLLWLRGRESGGCNIWT